MAYGMTNVPFDFMGKDLFNRLFITNGYLYDTSAYKSRVQTDASRICYVLDQETMQPCWFLTEDNTTGKINIIEKNSGMAIILQNEVSWEIGFKIKFTSTPTNGVIFSNNRNYSGVYTNSCVSMYVNGDKLTFGLYTNCSPTDWDDLSNDSAQFYKSFAVSDFVSVGWVLFKISYNTKNDKILITYSINGNVHNSVLSRISLPSAFSVKGFGMLYFGGSTPMTVNTPYMRCNISNFYYKIGIGAHEIGTEYKTLLHSAENYFLLSCDLPFPVDSGISDSIITGIYPIYDTTNTLFNMPTYSFTGSQYMLTDNADASFTGPVSNSIGCWFKASQTTSKAVIWDNGATPSSAQSCRMYISGNSLYIHANSVDTKICDFTDTVSWHFIKLIHIGGVTSGTYQVYLDGVQYVNLIQSMSYDKCNLIIGRDVDGTNYFKGNLSNILISNDVSTAVPTDSFPPKDY